MSRTTKSVHLYATSQPRLMKMLLILHFLAQKKKLFFFPPPHPSSCTCKVALCLQPRHRVSTVTKMICKVKLIHRSHSTNPTPPPPPTPMQKKQHRPTRTATERLQVLRFTPKTLFPCACKGQNHTTRPIAPTAPARLPAPVAAAVQGGLLALPPPRPTPPFPPPRSSRC